MNDNSSGFWSIMIVIGVVMIGFWFEDKSATWRDVVTVRFVACTIPFDGMSCPGNIIIPDPIRYRVDATRAEVVVRQEDETPTVMRNCIIFDAENWKCGTDEMRDGEFVSGSGGSLRFVGWWEYWGRKVLSYLEGL